MLESLLDDREDFELRTHAVVDGAVLTHVGPTGGRVAAAWPEYIMPDGMQDPPQTLNLILQEHIK